MSERAIHNKSGLSGLSLLQYEDEDILKWAGLIVGNSYTREGLCPASDCLLMVAGDGRYSYKQKKVAFGYQIVAFEKFRREAMEAILASKQNDSGLISHLCGTRNCCNKKHIVIEEKAINDQRTHCHFCMNNLFKKGGHDAVATFLQLGACPHNPQCGTIDNG